MQRKLITALYGRISKDDPRRVTIEIQQKMLREWSTRDELVASIFNEYWDDGVTGKLPLWERPAGKQLIEDAQSGKIQSVAVAYSDRFGRTLLDGLKAVEALEKLGVKLVAINDGWDARYNDNPLYFQFRMMMAEEEHRRISQRMRDGKLRAMDRDNAPPGGPLTFGYRMDENGHFVPDPDEAPVVVRIFELALKGQTHSQILNYVRSLNVKVGRKFQKRARGSEPQVNSLHQNASWHLTKIGKILRNRVYTGIRTWSGREFPCPPLIDQESFDMLQAGLADKVARHGVGKDTKGLVSGMFICGLCGAKYYYHTRLSHREGGKVDRYEMYQCDNMKRNGSCKAKMIRVDFLDRDVWSTISEYIRRPEGLIRKVLKADTSLSAEVSKLDQREAELNDELKKIELSASQIWAEQEKHDWPISWVQPKLNKLNISRQRANEELDEVRKQRSCIMVDLKQSSEVTASVASLRAKLDRPGGLSRADKRHLIQLLVTEGLIKTKGQGRQKTADISFGVRWGEIVEIPEENRVCPDVPKECSYGISGAAILTIKIEYFGRKNGHSSLEQ